MNLNLASLVANISLTRLFYLWVLYRIGCALYNVSAFHPLSRFPGPKLAALSLAYEFWFDMILVGRYTHEIKKMHQIYGPVVRIGPNELHCSDPAFIDEIYASGNRRRDKQTHYLNTLVGPINVGLFASREHELHRTRRRALNKFFSRGQIVNLEPEIHNLTQLLCNKILQDSSKKPLDVTTAYSCFTSDLIFSYCFGESLGFLDQDGWEPNFRVAAEAIMSTSYLFRFFPALRVLPDAAPYLAKYISDSVALLMHEMYTVMPKRILRAREELSAGIVRKRPVVWSDIILDEKLHESQKTTVRLSGEGFSITVAGTETTAWVLTVITFYVLSQPEIQARLTEELKGVNPSDLKWTSLEKIPYLTAVVLEGLRLAYGIGARTPRIAPDEDLIYRGEMNDHTYEYVIPKGTAIGMSAVILNHNEDLFPNSEAFIPERWLNQERRREMERSLFSFNRGSRQCVGINLAYCELYLATAALCLRVFPHMQLYQTSEEDVRYDHDKILAQPRKGSQVRVVMK
ncbi:putative cytochrome P450 [Pseudomassariella vexata]|uniref:Putative cytochrome P450 n=1 Tax=Pseudomassariella vexata TaxID=1141098 RepID=A0A1Y2E2T3_9PEZI|nr:putative cytochrome P450 [Pseudomassariella vexata]ORY65757.1 putative cytochrome P450 [Pseudomassariella vexata]